MGNVIRLHENHGTPVIQQAPVWNIGTHTSCVIRARYDIIHTEYVRKMCTYVPSKYMDKL